MNPPSTASSLQRRAQRRLRLQASAQASLSTGQGGHSSSLNVPVASPTTFKANSNLCSTSPCTSGPVTVVQFSFTAPATAGDFFWQCRVPCGLGSLEGFGGPMQTIGYMTGQMDVVS